ncbi:MAG: alpha/beta fold hydrolase, partial [Elainella sp.]
MLFSSPAQFLPQLPMQAAFSPPFSPPFSLSALPHPQLLVLPDQSAPDQSAPGQSAPDQSAPNPALSYLEWHQGQEPLLLLHGMADHSLVWASLGEFLQNRYHILAPDLRGHSNSSKPLQGYRCTDLIADLTALLAAQGWTSAHVVAHSWSAKVAAVWATQ